MIILKVMDCNAILVTVQITRYINVPNENFTNPYAFIFGLQNVHRKIQRHKQHAFE